MHLVWWPTRTVTIWLLSTYQLVRMVDPLYLPVSFFLTVLSCMIPPPQTGEISRTSIFASAFDSQHFPDKWQNLVLHSQRDWLKCYVGTGKMAWWLRAVVSSSSKVSNAFFWPSQASDTHTRHTDIHADEAPIHIKLRITIFENVILFKRLFPPHFAH